MADKIKDQTQFKHLQSRHIGLGTASTTKEQWLTNVHRDSYASAVGHPALLQYLSISKGVSRAEMKDMLIEKMVCPLETQDESKEIGEGTDQR